MQVAHHITLLNQSLWLSPQRCIFWQEQQALIVSDLHFGKTGHFRKAGIGIPQSVYKEDLQRLVEQLHHFSPTQLIVVGDFFHSTINKELDWFLKWRNDFHQLTIHLIKGNHDILNKEWYETSGINVIEPSLEIGPFCFVHDIKDAHSFNNAPYYFSGHIHPGISIKGIAKQSISLPCYYFGKKFAVLPAFSKFTGKTSIVKKSGEQVFAIIPSNPNKSQLAAVIQI